MRKYFKLVTGRTFASVLTALVASALPSTAGAASIPEHVQAIYDIHFNGFHVGSYDFRSAHDGTNYRLDGNARLSLLLGAIQWQGVTSATGQLARSDVKPQAFNFQFNGTMASGATQMAFAGDTVARVLHQPPTPPKPDTVPVEQRHLKGVLDPMAAVLALATVNPLAPCELRLPIYDGRQRFDLVLSSKGQIQLDASSGQPGQLAHVCRVRYMPIAGHRRDRDTQHLSQSSGIEVVMVPLANTSIFIPHKVIIPTAAGTATLTSQRVLLTERGTQRLAFARQ